MRIILIGPPGSGKGTQAQYIMERFEIPQISTGDMLRKGTNDKSALGIQIKQIMESGGLVPDDVIIKLVQNRIKDSDCAKGFLLDGFPRTVKQAEALVLAGIQIDKIVEIEVPDDVIVERLSGRWIHPASGRVYHSVFSPPNTANQDDVTGDPLVQRDDDKEPTVRKRLAVYHTQTQPVTGYFQRIALKDPQNLPKVLKIDGAQPPLVVCDQIFSFLDE
ncbi:MAG: adenylate kinase [Candidatus Berkiella sp.]